MSDACNVDSMNFTSEQVRNSVDVALGLTALGYSTGLNAIRELKSAEDQDSACLAVNTLVVRNAITVVAKKFGHDLTEDQLNKITPKSLVDFVTAL